MATHSLKILSGTITMVLLLASCGSSKGPLSVVEDDVYFNKKEAAKNAVLVPEVDVQDIIKKNPPQYNKQIQEPNYNSQSFDDSNINPNAAAQYPSYRAAQEQQQYEEQFLNTTAYADEPEEADEATRLRMQYNGSYDNYYTTNNYYNDGFNNGWNNWNSGWGYTPGLNIGWNNYAGWNVGWGWNMGWRNGWAYGWPHYNPYGGWNNWYGYNDPWCYNGGWGGNGWGGGYRNNGWCRPNYNWGHNAYADAPRTRRPPRVMDNPGSSDPRSSSPQRSYNSPSNPQVQGRSAAPRARSASEAQLINRNGQQIYVAPEQYRNATPRSYKSYSESVKKEETTREVNPRVNEPAQPSRPSRSYESSQPNRGSSPSYNAPEPNRPSRSYESNQPSRNSSPQQSAPAPSSRPSRSYESSQPSRGSSPSYSAPTPSRGNSGSSSSPARPRSR